MNTFRDIPGVKEIVLKYHPNYPAGIAHFLVQIKEAKPGQMIPVPSWMLLEDGNRLTSLILEALEKEKNKGGEVEIRKVAEIRGSRFNNGKTRMDLLDWDAMAGTAEVLRFGAEKYAAHNWRKGLPYMEIIASMLRHLWKFIGGEDCDQETGLPHVDHISCNAMFLAWMWRHRKDMDDRWKPPTDSTLS